MQKTVDFTLLLLGGVSVAFQLPVLILVSGWLGLVDPTMLRRGRRLALGLSTVLAAVLTPPDVFSLLLLLVPLYLLYELSIILLVLLPSGRVAQGLCVLAHGASEPLSHSVRIRGMVFRVRW